MNAPQKTAVLVLFLLFSLCKTPEAISDEYEKAIITPLKKTTTSTDGSRLSYPVTDNPEVTALIVEIPPGGQTGWHLHPVPVYAYMLSGSLNVEMENGTSYRFNEGDAIIEVVNAPHNGINTGQAPAKLIVFYTGEKGKPTTVKVQKDQK